MSPGDSITAGKDGLGAARAFRFVLSPPKQLLLLVISYWTFVHLLLIGLTVGIAWGPFPWRLLAGAGVLYLLPPAMAAVIRGIFPLPQGHISTGTRDFFVWWALLNLQVIFCRFTALEEVLRCLPGVYGCWLRLWGARVGRLIYWAAGLKILDRSYVRIGNGVIFGAGVRLNPHVLARNAGQELELILAPVTIGDRAIVGGYSLLTAGTEIAPDECTRACLISPPFGRWQNGVRVSKTDSAS